MNGEKCMKCNTPWKKGTIKYMFNVSYSNFTDVLGYMCKDCYGEFLLGITRKGIDKEILERRYPKINDRGRCLFTKDERADIKSLYESGYTMKDIACAYGFDDTQKIYGVLRRAGIYTTPADNFPTVEFKEPVKEPDIKDLGRVGAYMDAGWSPKKIAYEFGVEELTAKRAINTVLRYRKQKKEALENGKKESKIRI